MSTVPLPCEMQKTGAQKSRATGDQGRCRCARYQAAGLQPSPRRQRIEEGAGTRSRPLVCAACGSETMNKAQGAGGQERSGRPGADRGPARRAGARVDTPSRVPSSTISRA